MGDYFEINNVRIPFSEIKEFDIVLREYIYRPAFMEKENLSLYESFTNQIYGFYKMTPYAAIYYDGDSKLYINGHLPTSAKEANKIDILGSAKNSIGNALNIRELKTKRFSCINKSNRIFNIYQKDIPVVLMKRNGQSVEMDRNNPMLEKYKLKTEITIDQVESLWVATPKKKYLFIGDGIHIENAQKELERLKSELKVFNKNVKKQNPLDNQLVKDTINFVGSTPKNAAKVLGDTKKIVEKSVGTVSLGIGKGIAAGINGAKKELNKKNKK